jgi:hypothetical protein
LVDYENFYCDKFETDFGASLNVWRETPELQKFLQQERLLIREIFNNFSKPYHQGEIGLDKITKKEGNNNILALIGNYYTNQSTLN